MCTNLIRGFRSRERNPETGKRAIVYQLRKGLYDLPATVPCGQCIECRLKASRETAIRCMHEAERHERNTVITLTYATENLPAKGSIEPAHAVKFIKDLRAWEEYRAGKGGRPPATFKTYGCAEYGEKGHRPHYHIILFGFDFDDKVQANGMPPGYYTSDTLTEKWGRGGTQLMDLTFESAAYVARYITKKLTGPRAQEYGDRLPEQTVCVTQKGLGKDWYNEWKEEIYNGDQVYRNTNTGRRIPMRPPKYYDRRYEIENERDYERIKKERRIKNKKHIDKLEKEILNGITTNAFNQGIGGRDLAKQQCTEAKFALLKRGYESDT